ncbi:GntR family transcriptional regulator [Hyphomonas johnsonii]|uniref:Histidine utilization repressor n=1 Tax=Hyphomonas johnsonii MHS-2 TaxID=1280950 RepID=A0A059FE23_9PROT|nr:UTRA domain-containing protein [Hyphomonas johnsonii]KCZ88847.1 histidine utilization repressor [Hyphomonas johnsonii MHS-2]
MSSHSHHTIRQAILDRIQTGEWALGELIPGEAMLADEYGCARTTINRALQGLANDGVVIRKRKGGTRVCDMPVRQAKFNIPVVREQVEALGSVYRHQVTRRVEKAPPTAVQKRLGLAPGTKSLQLDTVHLADDRPFAFETRWVNTRAVPAILDAPLDEISANEWLVQTVPFSSGDVVFCAVNAGKDVAEALGAREGAAVFVIDRTTSLAGEFITTMQLYYREGYQLHSQL